MDSRGEISLVACLLFTLLLLYQRFPVSDVGSTDDSLPPPPPARLQFSVRRRRRMRKKLAEAVCATEGCHEVAFAPPPPLPLTLPSVGKHSRGTAALAATATSSTVQCTASTCNGHSCLLGTCLCGLGSGGEWCERAGGSDSRRNCASVEAAAYSVHAAGLERLAPHDYCAFYEPAYGILRVDERRWQMAQKWEAALWDSTPSSTTMDRNSHHAAQFGGYAALPDALGHVVEFGCGPFTQLQTMFRPASSTISVTLVDPLASHYVQHVRGCTYRDHRVAGHPVRLISRPVEDVDLRHAMAADGLSGSIDTLVMIAVLQSVRDVPAVLQRAYEALRPGGWLIFADRVFDARWDGYRAGKISPFWDVGHPCAVKQTVLDIFLAGFEEVYMRRYVSETASGRRRVLLRPEQRDEQIYFIGVKR